VHLTSYGIFWIATLHALTAGTDVRSRLFLLTVAGAAAVVVFLSLVRGLSPRPDRGPTRPGRGAPRPVTV
jgi:hypothetical protein